MKLRRSLFALIIAFPLLYLTGAVFSSAVGAASALMLVAGVCVFLLWPEKKTK